MSTKTIRQTNEQQWMWCGCSRWLHVSVHLSKIVCILTLRQRFVFFGTRQDFKSVISQCGRFRIAVNRRHRCSLPASDRIACAQYLFAEFASRTTNEPSLCMSIDIVITIYLSMVCPAVAASMVTGCEMDLYCPITRRLKSIIRRLYALFTPFAAWQMLCAQDCIC